MSSVVLWLAVIFYGLALGSFTTCAVYRLPRGLSIWRQGKGEEAYRSFCPSCKHVLQWFDLIPVFSWIALHGRCRYCGAIIPMRYPLIELSVLVLLLLIVWGWGFSIISFCLSLLLPVFFVLYAIYASKKAKF